MQNSSQNITILLQRINSGNRVALETLLPIVYQELQSLASHYLMNESKNATIQTTDLVHEAYIRLVDESCYTFENRTHFFAVASRAMRQFLVYYAKKKKAFKRGAGICAITLNENIIISEDKTDLILDIDRQLERLSKLDPQLCQIVEMRYFSGLTIKETALALKMSPSSVKREWQTAKAWLYSQLQQ